MASNSFGKIFKITTWGESHGKAIGVVIDGCPAGLKIETSEINAALAKRMPGKSPYTSSRKESDQAEILSGVFEGQTTGTPISILIPNVDADSSHYETVKDLLKPGHANFTYLEKYGIFDYRGGGRASARETACRVAAGAIAEKILGFYGVQLVAYVKQIGSITAAIEVSDHLHELVDKSPIFCPDKTASTGMQALLERTKEEGDSIGGLVEFIALGLPAGLGDPVYEKLEATLAYAMMGLPAAKAFEIGSGFQSVSMFGSEHNDGFKTDFRTETNWAGGTLGGISTGMPLVGRVAFKPASSILKPQDTVTTEGEYAIFQLEAGSRHDPCVAIRAVPVVKAMLALTLVDALLSNRNGKLSC